MKVLMRIKVVFYELEDNNYPLFSLASSPKKKANDNQRIFPKTTDPRAEAKPIVHCGSGIKASSSSLVRPPPPRKPIDFPGSSIPQGQPPTLNFRRPNCSENYKMGVTEYVFPRENLREWLGNMVITSVTEARSNLDLENRVKIWLNLSTVNFVENKQTRRISCLEFAERMLEVANSKNKQFWRCKMEGCNKKKEDGDIRDALFHLAGHDIHCHCCYARNGIACTDTFKSSRELVLHVLLDHCLSALFRKIMEEQDKGRK